MNTIAAIKTLVDSPLEVRAPRACLERPDKGSDICALFDDVRGANKNEGPQFLAFEKLGQFFAAIACFNENEIPEQQERAQKLVGTDWGSVFRIANNMGFRIEELIVQREPDNQMCRREHFSVGLVPTGVRRSSITR